jgi:hypothetical protein
MHRFAQTTLMIHRRDKTISGVPGSVTGSRFASTSAWNSIIATDGGGNLE